MYSTEFEEREEATCLPYWNLIASSIELKRLKAKVRVNKSIIREEGPGRPKTLLVIHQDFILKLLNNSPFNTCKRIALKLKNKMELKYTRLLYLDSW